MLPFDPVSAALAIGARHAVAASSPRLGRRSHQRADRRRPPGRPSSKLPSPIRTEQLPTNDAAALLSDWFRDVGPSDLVIWPVHEESATEFDRQVTLSHQRDCRQTMPMKRRLNTKGRHPGWATGSSRQLGRSRRGGAAYERMIADRLDYPASPLPTETVGISPLERPAMYLQAADRCPPSPTPSTTCTSSLRGTFPKPPPGHEQSASSARNVNARSRPVTSGMRA